MMCNVGTTERAIRIAAAVAFFLAATLAKLPPWGAGTAYALGAIALVTGLVGFCPLWKVFGIDTCSKKTS